MFDTGIVMVRQRVIQCSHVERCKKGSRSINIKDKFVKFDYWLCIKRINIHTREQNMKMQNLRNNSGAPYVCFILVLILISMVLRLCLLPRKPNN